MISIVLLFMLVIPNSVYAWENVSNKKDYSNNYEELIEESLAENSEENRLEEDSLKATTTTDEKEIAQSDDKVVISNYTFSPEQSSTKPITSSYQLIEIQFNVTYSANNNNSVLVYIPGFLLTESSNIIVKSNILKKSSVVFNEQPSSSKGSWILTLDRVDTSLQFGSVNIQFETPAFPSGSDLTGNLILEDSIGNRYIEDQIFVKTPEIINASGVQNSVLQRRLSSGAQWQQGKTTLNNFETGFIYSSTQSLGVIYGGDSSQNRSVISLSGPLIDNENKGNDSEAVVVEDVLPEGVQLATPSDYGIPEGEMTPTGFALQITSLSLNSSGNYIDGATKWGTSLVGIQETDKPEPGERQIYIGTNEQGRTFFRANLGTIPKTEKWTLRYHEQLTKLPVTNPLVVYPEYVNECFVSTKSMREAGKAPIHAGTWETLLEEKNPSYYAAKLMVDKNEAKKSEQVNYTLSIENFEKDIMDAVIRIPISDNEKIIDLNSSTSAITTQLIDGFIEIVLTNLPVNTKANVTYSVDTSELAFGYKINHSFSVRSINGIGSFYQGNNVQTEILAKVEALYVDENNQPVAESEVYYGKIESPYKTSEKQIPDYELIERPTNEQGLFLETREQVIYRYRRSVGTITIQYLDQDGQEIMDSKSFKKSYGEPYEYFPEEIMGYQFTSAENDKGIVDQAEIEIKFHYQGLLYFKEVPEIISFGTHILSKNTDVFFAEKFEHHLIVQDNRSLGNSWSIASRMSKEFTGLSGNQLKDSLYYLEEEKELLISDELNVIHSEESKNHDPIDLSEAWDEAHGLEMKVPAGAALAEEYFATMTWLLRDVPA